MAARSAGTRVARWNHCEINMSAKIHGNIIIRAVLNWLASRESKVEQSDIRVRAVLNRCGCSCIPTQQGQRKGSGAIPLRSGLLEKSLASVSSWAWTSMPTVNSQPLCRAPPGLSGPPPLPFARRLALASSFNCFRNGTKSRPGLAAVGAELALRAERGCTSFLPFKTV